MLPDLLFASCIHILHTHMGFPPYWESKLTFVTAPVASTVYCSCRLVSSTAEEAAKSTSYMYSRPVLRQSSDTRQLHLSAVSRVLVCLRKQFE